MWDVGRDKSKARELRRVTIGWVPFSVSVSKRRGMWKSELNDASFGDEGSDVSLPDEFKCGGSSQRIKGFVAIPNI